MPDLKYAIPGTTIVKPIPYMTAYGPIVIGNILGCFTFGIVATLTYVYFVNRPTDNAYTKTSVIILLILSLALVITNSQQAIAVTISHSGEPLALISLKVRPGIYLVPLLSNILTVVVQGMMSWKFIAFARVMRVSHGRRHTVAVGILSGFLIAGVALDTIFGLTFPIYGATLLKSYNKYLSLDHRILSILTALGTGQVSCFLAVDVLLTVAMTVYFRLARTGFATSNAILDTIVTIVLRNGLIVTACQFAQLVIYHRAHPLWTAMLPGFIGHIYVITLLSILIRPKQISADYIAAATTTLSFARPDATSNALAIPLAMQTLGARGNPTHDTAVAFSCSPVKFNLAPCRRRSSTYPKDVREQVESESKTSFPTNSQNASSDWSSGPPDIHMEDELIGFRAALMDLEGGHP